MCMHGYIMHYRLVYSEVIETGTVGYLHSVHVQIAATAAIVTPRQGKILCTAVMPV